MKKLSWRGEVTDWLKLNFLNIISNGGVIWEN